MKHFVLSLMLVVMTLLVFPFHSFAQDIPEDEDGDEIVIINQNQSGDGPARDILPVPINATLFRLSCCIEVEFLSNLGEVTITLTNLTTGTVSSTVANSGSGSVIIPFLYTSGLWQIVIIADNSTYFGFF